MYITQPRYIPKASRAQRHVGRWLVAGLVLCFSVFSLGRSVIGHADANSPHIESGLSGYCLDAPNNSLQTGSVVDSWHCNGTASQNWTTEGDHIKHNDHFCLAVDHDSKATGSLVVMDTCSDAPGQVWLRDKTGYRNPNSSQCLAAPAATKQLVITSCSKLGSLELQWQAVVNGKVTTSPQHCNYLSKGDKVACYAEQEWARWQFDSPTHAALLNAYTGGAPYEAWCADFVSYVYREAGYPFTQGEANGWNENDAHKIQNMGFSYHDPANYTPQAGDVAYFDYPGGHVEIVVSGGKTPTFIYGNSAIIDPATGNGQMAANTVTHDPTAGKLVYYLSPVFN